MVTTQASHFSNAKHTILSPEGGENSVFRVGKMAGLSSYHKSKMGGLNKCSSFYSWAVSAAFAL
ncbi:MAG: hypothetical protein NTZ50_03830, partial [Chloroflexi bacterium]|nr:hypothetical protein [Chloroflexota bacterium]